jgi:hypothetical protein
VPDVRYPRVGGAVGLEWTDTGHVDYLVQPACESQLGYHLCVMHPKADTHNNISAQGHFEDGGTHAKVWMCAEHGPEEAVLPKALPDSLSGGLWQHMVPQQEPCEVIEPALRDRRADPYRGVHCITCGKRILRVGPNEGPEALKAMFPL